MEIKHKQVTKEDIDAFLAGNDPMEHIIKIECGYDENKVSIIYRNEEGKKRIKRDYFKPFVWCNERTAKSLYGGDRATLKVNMERYNLGCKKLRTERNDGTIPERMEHGYKFMFYAKGAMCYNEFMKFFDDGGIPIYKDKDDGTKPYIAVSPVEQYMIQTGKRMFKGYDNYDDLVRLEWDLETEGLDPNKDAISQIGIRTNKGYEKIITIDGEGNEKLKNEFNAILEFFNIIKELQPDVITGHNTENFDWNFINVRLQLRNLSLKNVTNGLFPRGIYKKKKQQVLKLGGEMEYYYPTIMWGYNITDSLFAVRRAQAIDSNMKSATLKYVTKYSGIAKKNRVYVPGKIINKTWEDENYDYAFNDDNGNWFKISDRIDKITIDSLDNIIDNKTGEKFERVTGRYIVQRYLLDDLWETDKVELRYNESNYLVGKMLPVSFEKVCTMGTAAIWKYIMLAWSYEHNLAIPQLIQRKPFTGGLSRLLSVGWVNNIVKLDYNSLYPSIILTFGIRSEIDVMDVMSALLNYILTQREYYKGLKGKYGKEADALKEKLSQLIDDAEKEATKNAIANAKQLKSRNDKMQLPLKIVGNGFFGSYGSGSVFPHSDIVCAEETTCTGRQMLRLMISHFTNIGYTPIVGDTDGFNFQKPKVFRYTKDNPYVGLGLGRNVTKGKEYVDVDADVAEFEDTFLNEAYNGGVLKNGLGVDEYCDACIQFSRKNYADLMPDGSIKLVGNSIKSKKMPKYIEKFLDKGIRLLLEGNGKEFLEYYYDYVEKIYNLQIPLKDIATVGKIKTSIETYKQNCKQLTAAGTKKARQAWYELAIKEDLNVNMGDTIYYINTGNKKSSSDVQRITKYFAIVDGQEIDVTKELVRKYNKAKKETPDKMTDKNTGKWIKKEVFGKELYGNSFRDEDEIIFNCILLPNNIVEDEDDHFCDDSFEYNVDKYVDMFNKRIRPLLVCFSKDIRTRINEKGKSVDNILISKPEDRKQFTDDECKLVAGEPYNLTDQDTYEQLMTMEDKEIKFWLSVDKKPPYTEECGMNWEEIKQDYLERMEILKKEGIRDEVERYNEIIDNLKQSDVDNFIEEGIIPDSILKLVDEDNDTNNFVSRKYGVVIGNIFDIIDKNFDKETDDE